MFVARRTNLVLLLLILSTFQIGCRREQPQTPLEKVRAWAAEGDAGSQWYLGSYYEEGEVVEQDYMLAEYWYRKAADQGNMDAFLSLGHMYQLGRGLEKNRIRAIDWYRRAAELGSSEAQALLSEAYLKGIDVPQDYVAAYQWANLAASEANSPSRGDYIKLRESIEQYLTRDQIVEAQRQASELDKKIMDKRFERIR